MTAGQGREWLAGHAGELHPRALAEFGLPPRTCAMELDMSVIETAAAGLGVIQAPAVRPIPWPPRTWPSSCPPRCPPPMWRPRWWPGRRGRAPPVLAAQPRRARRGGAAGTGVFLESIRLFDVYTGEQAGEGRKSLAYKLRFRAPDRTLTAEEASAARDAAVAEAERRTGAVLRGAS